MRAVKADVSRIIDLPPRIIAFLWQNWDIYDMLLGKNFDVVATTATTWKATKYGLDVTGRLVFKDIQPDTGTFIFIATGSLMGFAGTSDGKLFFQRTIDGKTAVRGTIILELYGITQVVAPISGRISDRVVPEALNGGEKAATMLAHHWDEAMALLSAEQQQRVERFLKREQVMEARRKVSKQETTASTLHLNEAKDETSIALELRQPRPRQITVNRSYENVGLPIYSDWQSAVELIEKASENRGGTAADDEDAPQGEMFYTTALALGQRLFNEYLSPEMRTYLSDNRRGTHLYTRSGRS